MWLIHEQYINIQELKKKKKRTKGKFKHLIFDKYNLEVKKRCSLSPATISKVNNIIQTIKSFSKNEMKVQFFQYFILDILFDHYT